MSILTILLIAVHFQTATLEVNVTNLKNDQGKVLIALFDSEAAYRTEDRIFKAARIEIINGEANYRFEDLPAGEYAIKVFHDENGNDEIDTNFVGIPKEGYGFSNNAKGTMGPPSFEKASFRIYDSATQSIRIIN